MTRIVAIVSLALALGCAGARGRAERHAASTLTVRGSDTMVVLSQRWAQAYRHARGDVSVQVSGGGSGVGIASLLAGTTDLAASSREVTSHELAALARARGVEPEVYRVAIDALAVYVHESSALREIELSALQDLYRGRITRWSALGGPDEPVVLYGRENNSGTYVFFKERVLDRLDFVAETQSLPGTSAVIHAVSRDRRGVGYGGIGYGAGVRLVAVRAAPDAEAVLPDERSAIDRRYPLARFLYLVRADAETAKARDYLEWILSDEGQGEVEAAGFFPLPRDVREAELARLGSPPATARLATPPGASESM
ncbi:MAG: substrate-binding domain-containing protein [Myxococcales bacterium]|nr:substrate-binding domain-containing protein [Myxococcales bacterium]